MLFFAPDRCRFRCWFPDRCRPGSLGTSCARLPLSGSRRVSAAAGAARQCHFPRLCAALHGLCGFPWYFCPCAGKARICPLFDRLPVLPVRIAAGVGSLVSAAPVPIAAARLCLCAASVRLSCRLRAFPGISTPLQANPLQAAFLTVCRGCLVPDRCRCCLQLRRVPGCCPASAAASVPPCAACGLSPGIFSPVKRKAPAAALSARLHLCRCLVHLVPAAARPDRCARLRPAAGSEHFQNCARFLFGFPAFFQLFFSPLRRGSRPAW